MELKSGDRVTVTTRDGESALTGKLVSFYKEGGLSVHGFTVRIPGVSRSVYLDTKDWQVEVLRPEVKPGVYIYVNSGVTYVYSNAGTARLKVLGYSGEDPYVTNASLSVKEFEEHVAKGFMKRLEVAQ